MQNQDFKWFLDNYNDIYSTYGVSYVAIKDKKILGVYSSYAEAVTVTSATEPPGTFIVQKCTGDEGGYTNYIASMNFVNC